MFFFSILNTENQEEMGPERKKPLGLEWAKWVTGQTSHVHKGIWNLYKTGKLDTYTSVFSFFSFWDWG